MTKLRTAGFQTRRYETGLAALALFVAAGLFLPQAAVAQSKGGENKPKIEDITLDTKDGVYLRCSYYPGADSKTTVPVLILHPWESSRAEIHPFALYLQSLKHAVLVPDLRGHGRSTQQRNLRPGEPDIEIKAADMGRQEIARTAMDVEACKQFLLAKNNAGELNIEQLCVVGFEFGALLAVNWAAMDWDARSLPAYKLGQDVKALALISPQRSYKGITCQQALNHPAIRSELSVLIVAGAEDKNAMGDAKRIFSGLEKFHTDASEMDLVPIWPATSLQGVKLLNARGFKVPETIAYFIDQRLVKKADRFAWRDRSNPLSR